MFLLRLTYMPLSVYHVEPSYAMQAHDMIDMAFAKKRVDDRKLWLLALEPGKLH